VAAPLPPTGPHESRLARLVHRFEADEPAARLSPGARLLMSVGPAAGAALGLGIVGLACGAGVALFLLSVILASFVGAGKSAVLGSAVANTFTLAVFGRVIENINISSWILAGILVYVDSAVCLLLLANLSVLFRTPWLGIGRRLAQMHEAGWYMLQVHPWIRRMAWVGVMIFVVTPFPMSGAVGGTLVARILGMSNWATWTANTIGSFGACMLFAVLGELGRRHAAMLVKHPLFAVAVVALFLAGLLLLCRWFLRRADRAKKQFLAAHEAEARE
jgi:uncharacterized membrane protein